MMLLLEPSEPRELVDSAVVQELLAALEAVGLQVSVGVSALGVGPVRPGPTRTDDVVERGRPHGLTRREVEVLGHLVEGCTNRDIAARLFLSVKTVERHLLNAYTKAGLRNRSEATAFVLRHGLAD